MRWHKEKRNNIILKKRSTPKIFEAHRSGLDFLDEVWNNLPPDITFDERVIFIEITERILKTYHKMKRLYEDEENSKKN